MKDNGTKITALYCRLSQDDGNVGDSMSIQSQKAILEKYAREIGKIAYSFYVDDGYSGTNFQRPSFQRMIADIEDGKIDTVITKELTPEGTNYRAKTRFARFYNLPELMQMFREVADIQTADMLKLPVLKVNYHNIKTKPSEIQTEMVAGFAKRAEKVRARVVRSNIDNMLKITNDGRKLALDQRLIDPMLPDDPNSRVNACVDNIYRIWEEHVDTKAAQLAFCDLSTPANKKIIETQEVSENTFEMIPDQFDNVYDDMRKKWGQRHLDYLKQYRKVTYTNLLTSGRLNAYLADIDRQAQERFERLIESMKQAQGITEQLKADNALKWVRRMNNIRACAGESVNEEIIYF